MKITFEEILETMLHTYKAKNADYGNSFDKTLNEFGLVASAVRLNDKMERIKSLIKSDAKVLDEKIDDTLLDMANYAVLTLLWLRNKDFKNDDVDNALRCLIEFGYDVFSKNDKAYKKLVEFFDKYNKADKAVSDIAKGCFDSDIVSGTINDIETHSVTETKLPQEYSVGETFTDANGVKLKAVKGNDCNDCYYRSLHSGDCTENSERLPCCSFNRKDGEEVKFIKVD